MGIIGQGAPVVGETEFEVPRYMVGVPAACQNVTLAGPGGILNATVVLPDGALYCVVT